jgi:1,2-beta-oligoglucan phosphorylase
VGDAPTQHLTTPHEDDLALERIGNTSGLRISLLPNGAIFAIEEVREGRRILISQSLGSAIAGSMGRLCVRTGGARPMILCAAGGGARGRIGVAADRLVWQGETCGVAHEVSLRLHARQNLWLWHCEVRNGCDERLPCDAVLIQDLGLGSAGFLMTNEAYACQYLDHHVASHPRMGPVLMGRQNLSQDGRHPWVAHGCLEGAVGFATDYRQIMGPEHRDGDEFAIPFGTDLPSIRLQHETACAALQSRAASLPPGAATSWTFFGLYRPDHPGASSDADLALLDEAAQAGAAPKRRRSVRVFLPARTLVQQAPAAVADPFDETTLQQRYPRWMHLERAGGQLLSFFTPDETHCRHVVLREKERRVLRRHGALLLGGAQMLPDEETLSLTCWMHGVFGAQLTLGNTSFHRLLSISRDPYNIIRGSGMRMLVEAGEGWRLLTVPSVFEMGLDDCRWIYRLGERTVTVSAGVATDEPAARWTVGVEGEPCRFLVFCHLVLGEHELAHAARLEIDASHKRFTFRPEPGGLWSQRYPRAVYQLLTSTPERIERVGADELLYSDGRRRTGAYATLQTVPTDQFAFAVVGSLTDPQRAAQLAARYAGRIDEATIRARSVRRWRHLTRGLRIHSPDAGAGAIDTILPWLAHDALVHVSAPHGLEQYTGGAWGTRDVCQGPMELLLSLEHDQPARQILRSLFAEQYAQRGDWPQWFMLEPYSAIRDSEAHGDVIVWPLKAVCDYVEATGDFAVLDESLPWRREDNLERTTGADPISTHVDKLLATVRQRFVPGTHLLRYGNGDWNDSLQPVDPAQRDRMVSSWTVALLYEQLCRYAEVLRRAGRSDGIAEQRLAAAMREDFNRFLIRDDTVAGYGVFDPAGGAPELLFHPHDRRTGIAYSLLPMTQGIIGGLFTAQQAQHHLALIRRHLTFADGVRLLERPLAYHGGPQRLFQRAESSAFFGREIGLMYVHAHLRCAQAQAMLGEAQVLWDALLVVNPIAVTERVPHASLRQRNTYFSSSDAAFRDRYQASAEWARVVDGAVTVDGGWRIYSSGPGLYANLLIRHALGVRRNFGARELKPCLPPALRGLRLEWPGRVAPGSPLP